MQFKLHNHCSSKIRVLRCFCNLSGRARFFRNIDYWNCASCIYCSKMLRRLIKKGTASFEAETVFDFIKNRRIYEDYEF